MAANRAYWLVPAFGLTFGAGWFLHGNMASGETGGTRILHRDSASSAGGTAAASPTAGPEAVISPQIRPLESLAEILELLAATEHGRDELAIIPLMEMLPRLMITNAGTVHRLLDELAVEAAKHPGKDSFTAAAAGLIFRWMTIQPEEAAAYAIGSLKDYEDLEDMVPFFLAYAASTRPGAGERLLAMVPEEGREDMGELIRKMRLMSDPASSLRDPATMEKLERSEVQDLTARWLRKDVSGVLAWRTTLPEGEVREAADAAILGGLGELEKDPSAVERTLAGLPPELATQGRLQLFADEVRRAARQRGDQTPTPDMTQFAARLTELMASQPGGSESASLKSSLVELGRGFAAQEKFVEAAAWAGTLPEGEMKGTAVEQIVGPWLAKDPAAASAWVDTLPSGTPRDTAASQLIQHIQNEDPATAVVWARSISEEAKRKESLTGIYQNWFRNDPLEAIQALQSLPAGEQQSLFKTAPSPDQHGPSDLLAPELRLKTHKVGP